MRPVCRAVIAPFAVLLGMALAPLPSGAEPIIIQDQLGRTIELDGPAKRIIVLPKPAPAMVLALAEGPGPLVGMHPAAQKAIMDGLLGKLFPDVAKIDTSIVGEGFTPNVEAMLKADPDVVIQWGYQLEDYVEPMDRVGLKVVAFTWGTYEIEAEQIEILGKILGREDRAKMILDWHKQVHDRVSAAIATIPQQDRKRILFISNFEGELAVWGRDELLFQVPGLRNVAFEAGLDQGTVTVDAEQVLSWDPDIIFINQFGQATTPADIYKDPRFAGLTAVKERRIYKTPELTSNSNETPMLWEWMAAVAYPDLITTDIRDEIATQFEAMYGKRPDAAEMDSLLKLSDNADSAGYTEMAGH